MEVHGWDLDNSQYGNSDLTWRTRVNATRRRGREKVFYENLRLSLREGTIARIDALLGDKETRLDFIREAIECAIASRIEELEKGKDGTEDIC